MAQYANLTALRRYLGITSTDDDVLLTTLLDAATASIDNVCQRTFSAPTASTRYFDPTRDVAGALLLFGADCCELVSVTNGDGTLVTAYVTEPRNALPYYAVRLKALSGLSWTYTTDAENSITVVGYWAYSRTPPADIQQACVRWAGFMYRQKDSTTYALQSFMPEQGMIMTPEEMPRDVQAALRPYRRLV